MAYTGWCGGGTYPGWVGSLPYSPLFTVIDRFWQESEVYMGPVSRVRREGGRVIPGFQPPSLVIPVSLLVKEALLAA